MGDKLQDLISGACEAEEHYSIDELERHAAKHLMSKKQSEARQQLRCECHKLPPSYTTEERNLRLANCEACQLREASRRGTVPNVAGWMNTWIEAGLSFSGRQQEALEARLLESSRPNHLRFKDTVLGFSVRVAFDASEIARRVLNQEANGNIKDAKATLHALTPGQAVAVGFRMRDVIPNDSYPVSKIGRFLEDGDLGTMSADLSDVI